MFVYEPPIYKRPPFISNPLSSEQKEMNGAEGSEENFGVIFPDCHISADPIQKEPLDENGATHL